MTASALIITALTAFGAMLLSWRNGRGIKAIEGKVEVVHKATNSLQDALVKAVRKAAHMQGVRDEKARQSKRKSKA